VGVPVTILLVAIGLLGFAARDALTPAIEVRVAPAVYKESPVVAGTVEDDGRASPETVVAQGPGWIEPAPYAISVQALAPGVVSEVLALEGDAVEKGQVVVRMIDDDARLQQRRARSELAFAEAELDRARAAAKAVEARAEELRDEVERKRPLLNAGGVSEGQLARLELRLRAAEHDQSAASAANRAAEAAVSGAQATVAEADLLLSRMEIRSPVSGVIMTRSVEPGTRVAMAGPGPGEGHAPGLFRIYNPERLQVRVDVPLADAAKVSLSAGAEITTEALPDRAFRGQVTGMVHEADIQRNTVEFKVAIHEPTAVLKPEMLVRVRFFSRADANHRQDPAAVQVDSPTIVVVPSDALFEIGDNTAKVWVVDRGSDRGISRASVRAVSIAGREGDETLIRDGLRPGDRVILGPPSTLKEGARVRTAPEGD
jgi:RND family efflux transporter MFP subunit